MTGKRIFVVDDDPDTIDYFSSFLEDQGWEVGTAGNATEAFSMIGEFQPDAVLIDVLMPGRSGLDLLVRLRRDPGLAAIPLIVITGSEQVLEDDCQSYLGSHQGVHGPDGVLAKPIDRAALLAVLGKLCGPMGE